MNTVLARALQDEGVLCDYIISEFIKKWYNEYEPSWYRRTYQFLHSCTHSNVYKEGNKLRIDIFIDYENMHYKAGVSSLWVVEQASIGWHGGYIDTDTHFWADSIDFIERHILIKNFIEYLQKYTGAKITKR